MILKKIINVYRLEVFIHQIYIYIDNIIHAIMKIANIILTILFILFAVVQLNDPDPWIWVILYLYVALMAGLAIFDRHINNALWFGIAFCLFKLIRLLPDFMNWVQQGMPSIVETMKAEVPHVELTREFLGLAICIAVLIFIKNQAKQNP